MLGNEYYQKKTEFLDYLKSELVRELEADDELFVRFCEEVYRCASVLDDTQFLVYPMSMLNHNMKDRKFSDVYSQIDGENFRLTDKYYYKDGFGKFRSTNYPAQIYKCIYDVEHLVSDVIHGPYVDLFDLAYNSRLNADLGELLDLIYHLI